MRFPNAPVKTLLLLYYFGSSIAAAVSVASVEDDAAAAMITPAPALDMRAEVDEAQLIGYNSTDGSYVPYYCQTGSTLSFSNSWIACVPSGVSRYIIPTGCFVDLGLTASGTSWPCTQKCQSTFIIERNGLNIGETLYTCGSTAAQDLYFRTPPITSTATDSTTAASTNDKSVVTSHPTDKASESSSSSSSAATNSADSATEAGSDSSSHHKDLAWIAGPIVGGVAAIVIAGLLIWIVKLRRKKRQEEENQNAAGRGAGDMPAELPDGDPTGMYYPAYQWQVEGQQSPPRQGASSNGYMVPTHWQGPWATTMKDSSGSSSPKELDTGMTPVELYAGSPAFNGPPTSKEG